MLTVARAAWVRHRVQLALEPSNIARVERNPEGELRIGGCRASAHETSSRLSPMLMNEEGRAVCRGGDCERHEGRNKGEVQRNHGLEVV